MPFSGASFAPRALAAVAVCLVAMPAHADWILPSGSSMDLGGGAASLGCTSLQQGGTLLLNGGTLQDARDIVVQAGAQLALGSGQVQLAQQWSNQGSVTVTSGQVTRRASPGCPLVGAAGPIDVRAGPGPGAGAVAVPASGPATWALMTLALAMAGALSARRRTQKPEQAGTPRP